MQVGYADSAKTKQENMQRQNNNSQFMRNGMFLCRIQVSPHGTSSDPQMQSIKNMRREKMF